MIVTKYETHIFPQTEQGRRIAYELSEKLKKQGAFYSIKEDTNSILIKSRYRFKIQDEDDKEDDE